MKRYSPIILLLASAVALVFGIVHLFRLRFEVGDVYPEYSSLRSDPLGTMAFYESLEKLPGFSIERDFSTASHLPIGKQVTYFHLAASMTEWQELSKETFQEIEQFVTGGGRLVMTMFPASSKPDRLLLDRDEAGRDEDPKPKVTLDRDRWGVSFDIVDLNQRQGTVYEPAHVENKSGLPLPETLDWHSGIIFKNLNPNWKPIYTRGTNAVMIQREFGRGAVVMATDSFFLSNEAMQTDRQAGMLAWLIGSNRNVMFDEAHLGVRETPGVATLMRKYRLHWFAAGLVVLALLFVWQNSTSLVPLRAAENPEDHVAGKDAAAGFVNLLRRGIPTRDLLATCFREWKKSAAQSGKYSSARIEQAERAFETENALAPKDREAVRAYRLISAILQKQIK